MPAPDSGMSTVFAGLIVLVTLLFLTPLLYHLPQAVLAAVIMMAVIGLVNFKAITHAWHTHKHDGIAAVVTFVATLAFAPHLDNGIMVGAGLAIILYLYRTMKPRVAILGRHPDGTLRDVKVHNLPVSENIIADALRRLAVFCQRVLFRGRDPGSGGQQPERQASADRVGRHQSARCFGG